ncbi:MAG: bifunctional D-glycero-beta-D-manno-heptose-7-phosphate kinase/D-glycero-beta-D-manno-heptose 1-phosphate adenylyltransferase HldE, partial [Gammaproteobacteria bacterium]|nr:bifunctional D-glycero-beta-D-manno-heptose-7-phosphate kinase/D-glycero-beta-D-manno-heptose 1-phosphate adenylyltransferase HldE [Gammaproteobacteria bacterium]
VALNITSLGGQAALLGVTGEDEAADILQASLTKRGVTCAFQRLHGVPTITKFRVLSRHQQLIRLDFEEKFTGLDTRALQMRMAEQLDTADVAVLSDYGKGTLTKPEAFIQAARAAGKPVLIDPKGRDFDKYRGASVLTPNFAEFEAVAGPCADEHALEEKGERLREHLELDALLITRSEHGMTLLRKGHQALHLPAHAREVFDVTGAGDTVVGILAAALAAGRDLVNATALANLGAGLAVTKLGAAAVTVPELEYALHAHGNRGVQTEKKLLAAVKAAKANGETVVMTNGCFDILHAGHVHYLTRARQLGDRLIIAVNDDASVHKLKGHGRPINSLERRMAVLEALECADWVVPFSEDTPERLICEVLPDVLVKGGDYRVEQIAGHACVLRNGGRVLVLDFLENCSSSAIMKKIMNY